MISTLLTAFFYTAVYCLAVLIFYSANYSINTAKQRMYIVFGVLFLSLVACCRNLEVGTDTAETISLYFTDQIGRRIAFNNLRDYLTGDIFYFIFAKILQALHLGERSFLFVLEILIITPVAITAYIKKDRVPIHVTMAIFLILYYQVGFNWIRQSVAGAFVLMALVLAQEGKRKNAVISGIVAVLFHSTALIGISLLLFTYAFMRIKNKYFRALFGLGFMILFMFLLLKWDTIFAWGINYGLFPPRYAGYLRVFTGQTSVDRWFMVGIRTYVDYFLRILLVALPLILSNREDDAYSGIKSNYYKMVAIIGLIIYSYILLGLHSAYGNRLTYAIEYVQILNLGMCYRRSNSSKGMVPLRNIIIFGLVIFYNVWLYYVLGWHDTVPFIFGS